MLKTWVRTAGQSLAGMMGGQFSFVRGLGVVLAGHALAGLMALGYTMLVSRWLGVANYGYLQSVMAVYSTLTMFLGPLNLATVHCISVSAPDSRPLVAGSLIKLALAMSGVCTVGVLIVAPWLAALLHGGVLPVVWMALLVTTMAVLTVFYGVLMAQGSNGRYAAAKFVEALLVWTVGAGLVAWGAGTSGAVLGYVAGTGLPVLYFLVRRRLYRLQGGLETVWQEFRTLITIGMVYGAIAVIGDLAVVIGRARLSAEASGLYAALYNMRHLVLPFCLAAALSLYSRVVGGEQNRAALWPVLLLVLGMGGAFVAVGLLAPWLPLRLIYGPGYAAAEKDMALYGVGLLLQMVSIVVMFYQVATRRFARLDLVLPMLPMVAAGVWPGLSMVGLIGAQITAWGVYLAAALVRQRKVWRHGGA